MNNENENDSKKKEENKNNKNDKDKKRKKENKNNKLVLIDNVIERFFLLIKTLFIKLFSEYKQTIVLLIIIFSIYIIIGLLGFWFYSPINFNTPKLTFAISILSLLSSTYIGIRHEKAKVQYNVIDIAIEKRYRHLFIEMFSSNESKCIIRLEKIELLDVNHKVIKYNEVDKLYNILNENDLQSYLINKDNIVRFEIINRYNHNLIKLLYGNDFIIPNDSILKLSFKRYDGKSNINVLVKLH